MKDQIEAKFNLKIVERDVSIHELIHSSRENRLLEMFGAAVYTPLRPINRVVFKDTTIMLD